MASNACGFIKLQRYDWAFNKELDKEIAAAPATDVWTRVVFDYHNLRKAVQACK